MPKLQIPSKLEPFLFTPKRFKIAFGGRGGAKSQSFADMLLYLAQTQGIKVGCFREMQNSIEDSVHSLLKDEVERMELEGFTAYDTKIFHEDGGDFRFKGLSRNPDAVKSMHGFKRFWVEEAQSISEESLTKLTPTLREDDSEIWFSMNPGSSQDPMSKRFLEPFRKELERDGYYEDDLHLITWINYYDNPWFPETLEKERQWDYQNRSRAEYDHIWLGHYNDAIEDAIIKPEWFDAAVDAHIKLNFKPRGIRAVSHDPSDVGEDPKGLVFRHGVYIKDVQENDTGDVNEGADWATDYAIEKNANYFVYDADGMGVSLKRQISKSLPSIQVTAFHGNDAVDDPDHPYQPTDHNENRRTNADTFRNKRAQYYWQWRKAYSPIQMR